MKSQSMRLNWISLRAEQRSVVFWIGAGLFLVVVIGFLDLGSGKELGLSLFYLIPVVIVTWFAGKKFGVGISVIAAITWYVADMLGGETYSRPMIGYWNAAIRFGFFVTVAWLLPALKALEQEKVLSRRDHLTGTSNRRHFFEIAQAELVRSQQTQMPISIAYIDIDGFKTINDESGHATGDDLLKQMVARVRDHLRADDVIARFGGDEFVLFLPATDEQAARFIIEGLLFAIVDEMRQHNWRVTFSIGAVTYRRGQASVEELVGQADELMFAAKKVRNNQVQYAVYGDTRQPHSIQLDSSDDEGIADTM